MSSTAQLVTRLKEAGEDAEFYPTTKAMLEVVAKDIRSELADPNREDGGMSYSILDIGAGNGSALKILCELTRNGGQKYAIEKSKILIDSLPADVFVIGTDFHQQTLIDKRVDVVFCNPPYSEYEQWMRRIVSEANCSLVYMVVPQRWKKNKQIADMIALRCGEIARPDTDDEDDEDDRFAYQRMRGECAVLDSASFEDSEFRQARAQIDIVKIKFKAYSYHSDGLAVDPFDIWFDETFAINADHSDYLEDGKEERPSLHELVKGQNLIEHLEELYLKAFADLLNTYRELEKLDHSLFKELGVDLGQVKGGLRLKISGLKSLYWKELFDNLGTITERLTSDSRKRLLEKLTAHTSIDFSAANAYAVVVWAIKNANSYFDSQLIDLYLTLADKDNIRNYKSNKRLVEDGWRYQCNKKEYSHYTLDYRLVIDRMYCFSDAYGTSYEYPNGLSQRAHDLLNDICTVAANLGVKVKTNSRELQWAPGTKQEFHQSNGDLFMDVRAYQKGTVHIRVDQGFMKQLNIEAGRLNGWLKNPSEAQAETGIEEAAELFGTNFKLKSIPLLAAQATEQGELFGEVSA
jgi:SAM-dependent methyltransferase